MTWPAIPTRGDATCALNEMANKLYSSMPSTEPIPATYIPQHVLDSLDTWDKFTAEIRRMCKEIDSHTFGQLKPHGTTSVDR